MPDAAFRAFAVDAPYAAQTLRSKLLLRHKELADALVGGYAHDWADYRHRVGIMEGLKEAISVCEADMAKQERQ